jgi:hypothetical protein
MHIGGFLRPPPLARTPQARSRPPPHRRTAASHQRKPSARPSRPSFTATFPAGTSVITGWVAVNAEPALAVRPEVSTMAGGLLQRRQQQHRRQLTRQPDVTCSVSPSAQPTVTAAAGRGPAGARPAATTRSRVGYEPRSGWVSPMIRLRPGRPAAFHRSLRLGSQSGECLRGISPMGGCSPTSGSTRKRVRRRNEIFHSSPTRVYSSS